MKDEKEMLERCQAHAKAFLRQGKAKGLDPQLLAECLIVERIIELFGIKQEAAAGLARDCLRYAVQTLQFKVLTSAERNAIIQDRVALKTSSPNAGAEVIAFRPSDNQTAD